MSEDKRVEVRRGSSQAPPAGASQRQENDGHSGDRFDSKKRNDGTVVPITSARRPPARPRSPDDDDPGPAAA